MFGQDMGITEIEDTELEAVAARWLNTHRRTIAPKSTSRRLTSMRTMGFVYGMEILKKYSAPTAPQNDPHPLPEGVEDLARLLAGAKNEQQRVLIALLGMCGLRISEARELRPQDVDLRTRTLKVYGKGSKYRTVEISSTAFDILIGPVVEAQLDQRPRLISYADRSARHAITTLAERAGISVPVASHDLRSTFATSVYRQSGHNVRVVQDLLGHAHMTTTQGYIGVDNQERRDAVEFMTGVLL